MNFARRRCVTWVLSPLALTLAMAAWKPALAGDLAALSPRSLGMGESLRGAAAGSAALFLNPSGISLARSYVVEAGYQRAQSLEGNIAHLAVADSTSAFNVGGGMYYTYATASPEEAAGLGRHEWGLALSFPLGDVATIGGTARYLRARLDAEPPPGTAPAAKTTGITFDAGLTIRPFSFLSVGLVGTSLRELGTSQATMALGGGVVATPVQSLVLAVDAVSNKVGDERRLTTSGGAEYTFVTRLALRGGGGTVQDGESFGTAGLTVLSEVGALDVGVRVDFTGESESLFIGLGARLFVPAP